MDMGRACAIESKRLPDLWRQKEIVILPVDVGAEGEALYVNLR